MSNPNKKRITVYLDLSIDSEKKIWDFLEGKRKTETIRSILSNYMNGVETVPTGDKIEEDELEENKNNLLDEEIDMLSDFIK